MSDQHNDKFIKFFKALANEDRLEIIKLLKKNTEMCAQEVEKHFYLEQSTTSHHLNTLKRAGITKSRKKGRNIFYSVDYDSFERQLKEFQGLVFD
ncbi:helix-turn-helix transcriptional regulator [bacterium]|nr:helix-turn-helix transcriptional regulator [bacterium]